MLSCAKFTALSNNTQDTADAVAKYITDDAVATDTINGNGISNCYRSWLLCY